MASLGEILAKEREARGLSIDDVSKAIKIQPKFIKCLEQEDFHHFSAQIYLKSFLRTYAQYLGLEPEKILSAYKESWARSELAKKPFYREKKYLPDTSRSLQRYLISVLLIIFFIAAALLSYLYQTHIWQQKEPYPRPTAKVAGTPDTKINDKSQKESLALPPLQRTHEPIESLEGKPSPSTTTDIQQHSEAFEQNIETPISHPEVFIPEEPGEMEQVVKDVAKGAEETSQLPLVLAIDALEDTWLRVSIDGVPQEDLLLPAGSSTEWQAKERFVLIIGHVAGTRLRLNGKEIRLPYTKTDVLKDFVLTKKDILP